MKRWLRYGLHAAIVAGVAIAAVKYLQGDAIGEALASFRYAFVPAILALALVYLGLKAWRFVLLAGPVGELPRGVVARAYLAGQAATLVPGGVAARAGLLHQAGMQVERSAGPVGVNSVLDATVLLALGALGAVWFPAARLPVALLLGIVALAGGLLAVPAVRRWAGGLCLGIAGRFGVREPLRDVVAASEELLTARVLAPSLALTAVAFLARIGALWLALAGAGAAVGPLPVFLAFALPTLLGRLSGLPAGVGVTEAGMIGMLATTAGVASSPAAAAVAVYRIGTDLFLALVGGAVYLLGWDGEGETVSA